MLALAERQMLALAEPKLVANATTGATANRPPGSLQLLLAPPGSPSLLCKVLLAFLLALLWVL